MTPRSSVPLLGVEIVIGLYLDERKRQKEAALEREQQSERWSAYFKELSERLGGND